MPAKRFFIPSSLHHETVILSGEELHHLNVMRLRSQDPLELVNGLGELAEGTLISLDKHGALIKITRYHQEPPPKPTLILAQALPKSALLEWIIEKGCELNVSEFWLFPGDYSEKKEISSGQSIRLNAIIISALKQCGRLWLPQIILQPPLKKWTQIPGTLLFGDTSSEAPLLTPPCVDPIIFCIGPEKGFSSTETTHLKTLKAQGIRLHSNTLRAETAGLVALSQLYLLTH
jgi:16S rRNA (uracil1498-N3)-methyltransferase